MHRSVVVTGVGLVTPLGVGKDDFSRHLFGGLSGIRPITLFDTARFDAKLSNEQFVSKAPEDVLTEQREKRTEAAALLIKLKDALARLQ